MGNLARLSRLLAEIQQCLRIAPNGLTVSSGFRGPELNHKVGGVAHSQHCMGLAADVLAPSFGAPYALALAIAQSPIEFDQLILEYNRWVHVSAPPSEQAARREVLSIFSQTEGYLEGIVSR